MWWHSSVASGLCCGARPLRCSPLIKSGERSPTSMNTSNGMSNFNSWMEWLWRRSGGTICRHSRKKGNQQVESRRMEILPVSHTKNKKKQASKQAIKGAGAGGEVQPNASDATEDQPSRYG